MLLKTWLPIGFDLKQIQVDVDYVTIPRKDWVGDAIIKPTVMFVYYPEEDYTYVRLAVGLGSKIEVPNYVYSIIEALVKDRSPYSLDNQFELQGEWTAESLNHAINKHWYNRDDLEAHNHYNGTVGREWEAGEVVEHYAKQLNAMAFEWAEAPNKTPLERTQGVVSSTLSMLAGSSVGVPGARLILSVADEDREYNLERGENFYVPGMEIDPYDINNVCNRLRKEATSGMPKD
jgi:hypothetical protein